MKKIFRTTFALAAIAAFVSCAEEISNPAAESGQDNTGASSSVEFVPMTFSTSSDEDIIDVKTTYKGRKVYWEEADKISVFSVGSENVNSTGTVSAIADDKTWVRFTAPADPDAASYYAVYPYSETNACDAEGKLTVSIPSVQTTVAAGFMSGSNTSVAYSVKEADGNVLQFRNISALLCISFANDADAAATKSVTIKAKKNDTEYWGLTGTGKVSFDADLNPVIEEGDVRSVTLNAPTAGFVSGQPYHIPVYAVGDVTGFEVTYLGQDDKEYVKTNNIASTLKRNELFNIGSIADPYLQNEFEIEVDFLNNQPFNTNLVAAADQVKDGETYVYTYSYRVADVTITKDLKFVVRRGCDSAASDYYEMTEKGLCFVDVTGKQEGSDFGAIKFPAIHGRYLSKVEAYLDAMSSDTKRRVYLTTRYDPGVAAHTGHANTSVSPYEVDAYHIVYELPILNGVNGAYALTRNGTKYEPSTSVGNISALINTSYLLRMRQSGLIVEKVVLKFTKDEPVLPTTSAE